MQEKEPLFEYIEKIKRVAEAFAMDDELYTSDNTTMFLDKKILEEDGKICIGEVSNCDNLVANYYNELGSIKRIIEFINNGDYEVYNEIEWGDQLGADFFDFIDFISGGNDEDYNLFEDDVEFGEEEELESEDIEGERQKNQKNNLENDEEYKNIMNKFRKIINKIVLQLYSGLKVMVNQCGVAAISVDDEETMDVSEDMYLIYDANRKYFNLMENGETLIEDLAVESAMQLTIEYLYESDMQRKAMELKTGEKQKPNHSYEGWKIALDKGQEER